MKKIIWFSMLIVIMAAFFASSHPDGLEKVAEKLGFIKQAVSSPAILNDYHIPFISNHNLSTIFAGVTGILLTFGLFWLSTKLLFRRKED